MNINGRNYFRFAAAVAINCMEQDFPKQDASPQEAAAYMQEFLELLFSGSTPAPQVRPITYPAASKIPLLIELGAEDQRLFWFHPGMSSDAFTLELEGLLGDALQSAAMATA